MNAKNNLEFNVENIFKYKYLIPIYQRNYAWGKDEIEALLEDIKGSKEGYFIGSLVVREKGEFFEVIDGQQRLTTLFLILKHLGVNITGGLQFEARQKSNETLSKIHKDDDNLVDLPSAEIANGFKFIKEYLEKNKDFNKSKILNAQILRVPVPDDTDLNHFFEIMNTRGEQLEVHQIVKANILKALDKKDQKIAAFVWDACANMDRYVQMNFEKGLRAKIFGDNWDKLCDEERLFEISLENNSKDSKEADGNSEERSLRQILQDGNYTSEKITQDEDENIRFSSIINFPNFLLQVNAAISGDIKSEKSINELLYDKNLICNLKKHYEGDEKTQKAKKFIYNILKFRLLFDKFIIKTDGNDKKDGEKWSLKMIAKKDDNSKFFYKNTFDDASRKLILLQSCLRITYTSPRTMEWIFTLLKQLDENKTSDDMQEILEKYAGGKVKDALKQSTSYPTCERIILTYLDYILYRECVISAQDSKIKQKLQNAFKAIGSVNLKNLQEWEFKFRNSIEHFYPQNPSKDSIERMDDETLNSFGNLALVTTSGNSQFSNLAPSAKLTMRPNIITQSLKLILMSEYIKGNSLDEYREAIKRHGEKMLDILLSDIKPVDTK
nr:DUF262 domain-containing protein [uncultured Campylobacter sp.]